MDKMKKKWMAFKRLNRYKKYKKRNLRKICMSMLDFEYAPLADINDLTGRLVRENGVRLYEGR